MAEFDLNKVFREAFSRELPASFELPKAPSRRNASSLGARYYNDPNEDLYRREFFMPVYINKRLIPFAIVGMGWSKNIITTPMPDRGGSVHELIQLNDYSFNIKGLLVNEDGEFPEEEIINIEKLFKINAHVELRSAMTDIVLSGISDHSIIIKEIKWPVSPGIENIRAFEIDAESDSKYELNEKRDVRS